VMFCMVYHVHVIVQSKHERVRKIDKQTLKVSVTEPACKGKANRALLRALCCYFSVSSSAVQIVQGYTSKKKCVTIG